MARSATWSEPAVVHTEAVPPDARVRHIDQLSDDAQAFVAARSAPNREPAPGPLPADLEPGDVVVYTDYLLVD